MDLLGKRSVCCGSQCCWDWSVGQKALVMLEPVMLMLERNQALPAHCCLPCNTTERSSRLAGAQRCRHGHRGQGHRRRGHSQPGSAQHARREQQTGRAEPGTSHLPLGSSREMSPAFIRPASSSTNQHCCGTLLPRQPPLAYSFPPGSASHLRAPRWATGPRAAPARLPLKQSHAFLGLQVIDFLQEKILFSPPAPGPACYFPFCLALLPSGSV